MPRASENRLTDVDLSMQDVQKDWDVDTEIILGKNNEVWFLACCGLGSLLGHLFPMATFGVLFYNSCPADPRLPQLLIMGGFVLFLNSFAVLFKSVKFVTRVTISRPKMKKHVHRVSTGIMAGTLIWFAFASFRVAAVFNHSSDPKASDYCKPLFYNYFVTSLVASISSAMGCVGLQLWLKGRRKVVVLNFVQVENY